MKPIQSIQLVRMMTAWFCLILSNGVQAQNLSMDKNHVVSRSAKVSGFKNADDLLNKNISEVGVAVSYMDRLGRPDQQIAIGAAQNGNDIVSFHQYNENTGLETKRYLPYVSANATNDGAYIPSASTDQSGFYMSASHIDHDAAPWSELEIERSPFKRALKSGGLGEGYQLADSYYTSSDFKLNEATDQVFEWTTNDLGDLHLEANVYFPSESLVKSTVKNPENEEGRNNHQTITFTNYKGQKILTRYFNDTEQFDTYFVYDPLGHLVYVIPPKASLLTRNSGVIAVDEDHVFDTPQVFPNDMPLDEVYYYFPGATVTIPRGLKVLPGFRLKEYPEGTTVSAKAPDSEMAQLVFKNEYDHRNQLVAKKVPGAEPVFYVYDNSGRLILSQDGNQRESNQWTFTKYDYMDRPILTGIIADNKDREVMQSFVKGEIIVGQRYESRGSAVHGYTDVVWPTDIAENDYLVVSYYDDYDFMDNTWDDMTHQANNGINDDDYMAYPGGIETGGKIRVLGSAQWLKSVKYYDEDFQLIQGISDHHMGYLEKVYTQYNWLGEVVKTRFEHELSGSKTISIEERFVYDDGGRLVEQYHSTDNEAEILIATYQYNELGELVEKNLHKQDDNTFVQSIDYRYNIRGQLININQASRNTLIGESDDHPDRFGMNLYYDSSPTGLTFDEQTNGNLAGTTWGHAAMTGADQRSYAYGYDEVNRLTAAAYKEKKDNNWNTNVDHYNVSNIQYDLNGNIETLQRKQSNALIDDLDYEYNANQLTSIDDKQDNDEGFKDGSELDIEYTYDANGNMISDANKLIQSITYNLLNKPETITFSNGDHIDYTYDAAGTRLNMTVTSGGSVINQTDYSSGMIFEDDELSLISMPQGRIVVEKVANDYNYDYQYHLSDHLGNIRSTVAPETRIYLATMESEDAIAEEAQFLHLSETRQLDGANARSGNESARLNPGDGRIIGPAKALKVYAGDIVDLEVFAKYLNTDGAVQTNSNLLIFDIVASAYGLSAGGEAYDALSGTLSGASFLAQSPGDVPAAYLNYIFYDKNYENPQMGHQQISDVAKNTFEKLTLSITVPTEGYLYTYVSNESSLDANVYFDDFSITHTSAAYVHQADDYYPFGLPIAGNKYEDLDNTENRFLYQGKEWQTALALNLYDFHARQYDPATGRFLSSDPKNQFASGYTGMGNNPIIGVDPDGQFWHIIIGAIVGGISNTIQNWDDISNVGDFFINWEKGAFVGAVAAFTGNVAGGGLIGGAAGGFVGGSGNAAINGASFEQSLTAGGYGAIGGAVGSVVPSFGGTGVVPGAALGAVSGGLTGGITAELTGGSFGSGFRSGALSGAISGGISGGIAAANSPHDRGIVFGNLKRSYLEDYARSYLRENFPERYGNVDEVEVRNLQSSNKYGHTNLEGRKITVALDRQIVKNAVLGRTSDQMYLTSGHELVHADDYRNIRAQTGRNNARNYGMSFDSKYFSNYSEVRAYQWSVNAAIKLQFRVEYYQSKLADFQNRIR